MSQIEQLRRLTWTHTTPEILYAREAFERTALNHRFYMVIWKRDLPAGFSLFEFTGIVSGGYEIRVTYQQNENLTALEADEWVLAFQHD